MDSASPGSMSMMWMSAAFSARKTSPRPLTFISGTPSPVSFCLRNLPMPPEPSASNCTCPWYATIVPTRAMNSPFSSALRSLEFCSRSPGWDDSFSRFSAENSSLRIEVLLLAWTIRVGALSNGRVGFSAPSQLVQPLIVDAEVVGDLVDDGDGHLVEVVRLRVADV